MKKSKYKLTIFIGDIDESVCLIAKSQDSSAYHLHHSNYQKFISSDLDKNTAVYTSLGDLPKNLEIIYNILSLADKIVYCPPATWSDNKKVNFSDPGDSTQGLTKILLNLLPKHIQILNLISDVFDPNPLVDTRKTDSNQIWVAGCSISHGMGVNHNERYGELIATKLNLPCSFLTRPGSAIDWATDQILRSDIREGDLVILGITNPERITYFDNNKLLNGVNIMSYYESPEYKKIVSPHNLYTENTLYTHFYSIQKVINYCNKAKAKLLLVGIMLGQYNFLGFLKSQRNYIHVPYKLNFDNSTISSSFLDLGSDNDHPGIMQHQQYAELILEYINSN